MNSSRYALFFDLPVLMQEDLDDHAFKLQQNPDGRVWFTRWQDGEPVKGFLHQTRASAQVQYNAALRVQHRRVQRKHDPMPPGFGEF